MTTYGYVFIDESGEVDVSTTSVNELGAMVNALATRMNVWTTRGTSDSAIRQAFEDNRHPAARVQKARIEILHD